jgi:hypothetical protein
MATLGWRLRGAPAREADRPMSSSQIRLLM